MAKNLLKGKVFSVAEFIHFKSDIKGISAILYY